MLEPIFNEYSANPLIPEGEEADAKFKTLVKFIHYLERYGINIVRHEKSLDDIPFTEQSSFGRYCNNILMNRTSLNSSKINAVHYLYSRFKFRYIDDDENVLPNNLRSASYVKYGSNEIIEENPLSLIVAYFLKTFTIGFDNEVNSPLKLKLTFSDAPKCNVDKGHVKLVDVTCVTSIEDIMNNQPFIELLASQDDLFVPKVCEQKKSFHLPEHHGMKECKEHGDALLKNPYVKDILSTRSFRGGHSDYISKINKDGSIEVCLYWTKPGYGLLISTTGQDIIQTTWIAKKLDGLFGKNK